MPNKLKNFKHTFCRWNAYFSDLHVFKHKQIYGEIFHFKHLYYYYQTDICSPTRKRNDMVTSTKRVCVCMFFTLCVCAYCGEYVMIRGFSVNWTTYIYCLLARNHTEHGTCMHYLSLCWLMNQGFPCHMNFFIASPEQPKYNVRL